MTNDETIAQKSLEFLESKIKSEQEITPLSILPYPQEVMEKALLAYIPVVLKNDMSVVDAKMKIHLICSALAGCIEDSDAEFISKTEDMLNKLSDKSATKGVLNIDDETKKSFLSKGGTESNISRYLKLLDEVGAEHERLIGIADNALQSVNIG